MSYLHFDHRGKSESGKTEIWSVRGSGGDWLGQVRWYGPWRKYCFDTEDNCTLDAACLTEIADFCRVKTEEHRSKNEAPISH